MCKSVVINLKNKAKQKNSSGEKFCVFINYHDGDCLLWLYWVITLELVGRFNREGDFFPQPGVSLLLLLLLLLLMLLLLLYYSYSCSYCFLPCSDLGVVAIPWE